MDSKLTNELIIKNIELIFCQDDQCLHKNDFVSVAGARLKNSLPLIEYLLKHDLIEIEDDPAIFYLTTYGYDIQEEGRWYDYTLIEEKREPSVGYTAITSDAEKNVKPIHFSPRMKFSL